jgi:hypothetical protein
MISAGAARPLATDQPTTDHATTAQSTTEQHPKITSRTAHLGITIRRAKNPDKTGTRPGGPVALLVDLERTA